MTTTTTAAASYDPATQRYTFLTGTHTIAYRLSVQTGRTCHAAIKTPRATFPTGLSFCGRAATYRIGGLTYCARHARREYPDVVAALRAAGGAT